MPRVIEVIENSMLAGVDEDGKPLMIRQYWSLDGKRCLAEFNPHKEKMWADQHAPSEPTPRSDPEPPEKSPKE